MHDPRLLDRWCRAASERRHDPTKILTERDLARVADESGIDLDVLVEHALRHWGLQ